MDYYIEIKLIPRQSRSLPSLLSALFEKLFVALSAHRHGDIGLSLPAFKQTPGNVIRLHGQRYGLENLRLRVLLNDLSHYIWIGPATPVPDNVQYRHYRRVQLKTPHQRMKRYMKRRGAISADAPIGHRRQVATPNSDLPYIWIKNQALGRSFRMFIAAGDLSDTPTEGTFNHYGLSSTATVPFF
ncbi:type I-F CRISPR-associated endoribonuclease Cas6/Csy4 [Raoultella terrigena]|uniref:type I-F CRISPR-associated endoribonuclease Cas6/Csy4 n=1 Tax=Raoultella terrigena TaxID=577 RepID=UPI003BA99AE4